MTSCVIERLPRGRVPADADRVSASIAGAGAGAVSCRTDAHVDG